MYTGRTVSQYRGRNAQPFVLHRDTGSTRYQLLLVAQHSTRAYEGIVTATYQQLRFFFQRHSCHHLADVVSFQFHLSTHSSHCQKGNHARCE